ncbi:MAG TPA: NrfD/PsrC family molybdoenzyme membrane anchor subunit [Kofleriaceae bacterium]|jgi:molybdopterin-containing oxidoreductase family membrane subunit
MSESTAAESHGEGNQGKAREHFRNITRDVAWVAEAPKPHPLWLVALGLAVTLFAVGIWSVYVVVTRGIGVWGNHQRVCWAWDITNFVWWIGIGHAGTLISAVLYLTRQQWRVSINRSAEAMTIFAVMAAGIFPLLHTGRPWFAWWMIPLPNDMGSMWPQFRSPLMWDVFAVTTYLTTSLLFWYMGMVPDLATFRDRWAMRGDKVRAAIYGVLCLGWRGSARQWHRYERAYLILAGLATPLVFSVHSVVSFDFATSQLPGWHTTIFPPYFVAGAIYSGFAMVMTLLLPLRYLFNLKHIITQAHIHAMCKVMAATGMMVGFAYGTEFFVAWYSGNDFEQFTFLSRVFGPFWWSWWGMLFIGNVVTPQFFWSKWVKNNNYMIWILCILVNIGMWGERFVIIAVSLSRSFLPSAWAYYHPTRYDIGVFVGTIGMFLTFFLLFFRFAPVIAISEVKGASDEAHAGKGGH